MALVACGLLAIGLGITVQQNVGTRIYANGPGGVEVVRLDDGSRAWLDANTELHVGYRWWRRNVDVVRGHASFDVAHDAQRPFIVTAGGGLVTARGPRFHVNLLSEGLVGTFMQGKVEVASNKTEAPTHMGRG